MSKTKLVFKKGGFAQLRKAPGVVKDLDRRADRVAAEADRLAGGVSGTDAKGAHGFLTDSTASSGSRGRARASVRTVGQEAMRAEATDRVLLRALDAGR